MSRLGIVLVAGLFAFGAFAGCLEGASQKDDASGTSKQLGAAKKVESVFEGAYRFDGTYSYTLVGGPYAFSPDTPLANGKLIQLPSKVLPTNPNGRITMGLWLPDVPPGTKVPVLVDAGPYYGNGDLRETKPANRLGKWMIENFVPHGYAVAQLSVRGTGDHGGCMDLMGIAEQTDLSTAIDWLGTQPWSNGAVGMIGRSYDGSTPWEVAAQGNKYLKTIVPISGLSDFFGLMTYNGTSESRAAALIHGLYFTFGLTGEGRSQENIAWEAVCPEAYRGFATAVYSTIAGDRGPAPNDYYFVRNFQKFAREKWKGSVFMIHGLQDWNVEPHMGAPVADLMEREGYTVKQLWGQWGHNYPDRPSEHRGTNCGDKNTRWDWAEIMLHWFDRELKGLNVTTGPAVQILDGIQCRWRSEEHFPPRDANWTTFHLGAGNQLSRQPGAAGSQPLSPAGQLPGEGFRSLPGHSADFFSPPFETSTLVSGLPRLHVTVTPATPGGHLAAFLYDVDDKGALKRIGWTQMNIRYYDGGDTAKPVVPGLPIVMKMEFEPLDAEVPAGHKIMVRLWQSNYADHIAAVPPGVVTLNYGGQTKSVLELPILTRGADAYFVPPAPSAVATPKPIGST
ncbi:MAG TPA: CocE/NonD family hydrolase [Candidatus Thermoplasmatota archaeon]|nr:CocE/NonD family hydrolase [Candidatus Thermoplasmatota archaeon]